MKTFTIHNPNSIENVPSLKSLIQQNSPSFILESARESLKTLDKNQIVHSQPQRRHFLINSWKANGSPSLSPQLFFDKEENLFLPKPLNISRAHSAMDTAFSPHDACFSPGFDSSAKMKRKGTIDDHKDDEDIEIKASKKSLLKSAKVFRIKHKSIFSPETRSRGTSFTGLNVQEISMPSPQKSSPVTARLVFNCSIGDIENSNGEEKRKDQFSGSESFSKIRINFDSQLSRGKPTDSSIFSRMHKSNKSSSPESKDETEETITSCFTEESGENTEIEKKSLFYQANRRSTSERTFDVKVGEILGEGAYAEVYKVLNVETGEFLAMKKVKSTSLGEKTTLDVLSLHSEINVYKNLEHEHIVKYLGTQQVGEQINIFMEYMPGGSVLSMLKQYGSFEENVIRKFTKQLLLGLEYLHAQGVIHRDIKGANILSDASGTVKLADFGAAKHLDYTELLASVSDSDGYESIKGSLYWMAPELLNQQKHGRKIDIWSLGCTVIEMATARHPWPRTKNYTELVMDMVTQRHPPIPAHLTEIAQDFIKQCCQFDRKLRPPASKLLNHPFVKDV